MIFHSYSSRSDSIMLDAWILRLMNFVGCAEYRFLHALRSTLASSRLTFWRRTRQTMKTKMAPRHLSVYIFPLSFPFHPFLSFITRSAPRESRLRSLRADTRLAETYFCFRFVRLGPAPRTVSLRSTFWQSAARNTAGFCFSSAMDMPASNSLKFADLFTRTLTHLTETKHQRGCAILRQ